MKKLHVLLICFSLCMISCKKENVTLFENEDNSKVSY